MGWRRELEIRREGYLWVQGVVLDKVDRYAEVLHGGNFITYLQVFSKHFGKGLFQDFSAENLRGFHAPHSLTADIFLNPQTFISPLKGISQRVSTGSGPIFGSTMENASDLFRRDPGAGSVMHGDKITIISHMAQCTCHGIAPCVTALHHMLHFHEPCLLDDRGYIGKTILPGDDNDVIYFPGVFKSGNAVPDDWLAADFGEHLVKAHPFTGSGCGNDGGEVFSCQCSWGCQQAIVLVRFLFNLNAA